MNKTMVSNTSNSDISNITYINYLGFLGLLTDGGGGKGKRSLSIKSVYMSCSNKIWPSVTLPKEDPKNI